PRTASTRPSARPRPRANARARPGRPRSTAPCAPGSGPSPAWIPARIRSPPARSDRTPAPTRPQPRSPQRNPMNPVPALAELPDSIAAYGKNRIVSDVAQLVPQSEVLETFRIEVGRGQL